MFNDMGKTLNDDGSTSVASAPRRRWLRYSLRSLLVLTALVAVCIGLLIPCYERARAQREIIAISSYQWAKYEEEFDPDSDSSPVPSWLAGMIDHHYFYSIVDIGVTSASDENLARLKNLPQLEHVGLGVWSSITTEGFSTLASLPNLRSVAIVEYRDAAIVKTDDEYLQGLGRVRQLKDLFVGAPVNDKAAFEIAQLQNLTKLYLLETAELTAVGFEALTKLANLKDLEVMLNDQVNGRELNKFANLEQLRVCGRLRTESAKPLQLTLSSRLQVLEISCMDSLTDADLAKIAELGRLTKLVLEYCPPITDAGIANLANLKTLTHLKVKYCNKVTPAAVKSLRAAMPKVTVEFTHW
ncbi:MAG: hypothetical protein SGJ20_21795 [Planctomycetota bacterium]|nr:hypothetical protein [Planctomycetota bacterium]